MNRILALTQCFPCGSWVCIEKILDKLADDGYEVIVVGLGNVPQKNKKLIYHTVPYLAYNRFGNITSNPLISALWNLPLFAAGLFYFFIKRPKVVTYNGLASGLVLSPSIKIFGSRNVIMYHSYLGQVNDSLFIRLAKFCGKSVDLVIANSRGSAADISQIFDSQKVIVNEHFAEDIFFEKSTDKKAKSDNFTVSYAGRIDEDKLCFPLMEAAKRLYEEGNKTFVFNFAGAGSAVEKIIDYASKYPNMHYLGYINGRSKLKEYYENADVVWSLANETYLCVPAVEALATGRPVIIPIYSEVKNSEGKRALVEKSLLQDGVGWFVNTDSVDGIISLLKDIQFKSIPDSTEDRCISYAGDKYSRKNLNAATDRIKTLFH